MAAEPYTVPAAVTPPLMALSLRKRGKPPKLAKGKSPKYLSIAEARQMGKTGLQPPAV